MAKSQRKQRLESLLRREIASCVATELRDPRIGFVTITRVEMTGDLQHATAFYTVLGDEAQITLAGRALAGARGYVQQSYAGLVKMRHVPRLRFAYDEQEAKRQRMDDLIARARSTDPDQQEPLPEE